MFFGYRGVPRPVFLNLKSQKLLNSFERLRVCRHDGDTSPCGGLFILVCNLAGHLFHNWNTEWHGIVYKHRDIKVPALECLSYMCEVHSDRIAVRPIGFLFHRNLDCSAIRFDKEVMGRGGLRKTHPFFPTLLHVRMRVMHRTLGWRFCFLS